MSTTREAVEEDEGIRSNLWDRDKGSERKDRDYEQMIVVNIKKNEQNAVDVCK